MGGVCGGGVGELGGGGDTTQIELIWLPEVSSNMHTQAKVYFLNLNGKTHKIKIKVCAGRRWGGVEGESLTPPPPKKKKRERAKLEKQMVKLGKKCVRGFECNRQVPEGGQDCS